MGNFSLLLLAKLMDWPFPFVITISHLAWFKACLLQPHFHFHCLIFHYFSECACHPLDRSYTFVSPLSGMLLLLMTILLFSEDPCPKLSHIGDLRF